MPYTTTLSLIKLFKAKANFNPGLPVCPTPLLSRLSLPSSQSYQANTGSVINKLEADNSAILEFFKGSLTIPPGLGMTSLLKYDDNMLQGPLYSYFDAKSRHAPNKKTIEPTFESLSPTIRNPRLLRRRTRRRSRADGARAHHFTRRSASVQMRRFHRWHDPVHIH